VAGWNQKALASRVVYIVNDEGRNAEHQRTNHRLLKDVPTLAEDIPALKIMLNSMYLPTLSLTASTTAR
jgi:hypothetical protein